MDDATRPTITSRFARPVGKAGSGDYAPITNGPTIIINKERIYL
jgi:hypothetical protein